MSEKFKEIAKDVASRTIKTMLESAGALLMTHTMVSEVDWRAVVNTVAMAGIICLIVNTAISIKVKGE